MQTFSEILQVVTEEFISLGNSPDLLQLKAILMDKKVLLSDLEVNELLNAVTKNLVGLGPLMTFAGRGTTDVMVNSPDAVWVDGIHGLQLYKNVFNNREEVEFLARRLAGLAKSRLDDAHPFVDGRLPDGTRLHAMIPPISGPCSKISLRFPSREIVPIEAWTQNLCSEDRRIFADVVEGQLSFIISGRTGSGKTTLMKSILASRPETRRTILIEESNEIEISNPAVVSLVARQPNAEGNGAIPIEHLVRQSLRMRPDSIVIGEIRGREILDFLLAISSGHIGSGTTIHATQGGVEKRVQMLGLLAGVDKDFSQALFAQTIDAVIHCERTASGRQIVEIKTK